MMEPVDATGAAIRFGTDGWRAVIADDFTFENVRRVARAIGRYLLGNEDCRKGVIVGYDCRFLSDRFARAAAEEIASSGIPVCLAESFATTPAIAFAVRNRCTAGAVVITASHNPWQWNGVKFKASYGGSAAPEIMRKIEAELPNATRPMRTESGDGQLETADLVGPYLEEMERVVDFGTIAAPLLRVYAEAGLPELVQEILARAEKFIRGL